MKLLFTILLAGFCFSNNTQLFGQKEDNVIKTVKSRDFKQAEEILFYDDFNDGIPGKMPDNWEIRTVMSHKITLDSSRENGAVTLVDNILVLRISDGNVEFLRPLIKAVVCDTCFLTFEFDYKPGYAD